MSAKQFQHFMKFHQQFASLRGAKRAEKVNGTKRGSSPAVAAAKEWLAGTVRQRSYSPSL
jgi:hypothetical protein